MKYSSLEKSIGEDYRAGRELGKAIVGVISRFKLNSHVSQSCSDAVPYCPMEELREIWGQVFLQCILCGRGLVDDFLQCLLRKLGGYSRSFGSLDEMPAADSVHNTGTIGSRKHGKAQ
jgi:hypothetical protein